jgi:hypothetical protein
MTRSLSALNVTEVEANHLHEVIMVKMEFGTPVYCHSGIGTITFDSNDYLGVGSFGSVSQTRESDVLSPAPVTLQLSGVDAAQITEALDAGSYGDVVTMYKGYRQDDGTLVDDPWLFFRGWYEYATVNLDIESTISIRIQHALAILGEKKGTRFTDEDQQRVYAADVGFEFVHAMGTTKLFWAAESGRNRGGVVPPPRQPRQPIIGPDG